MGIGPIDIALWDYAGKRYDAPIHETLGTYRERLPAYASTYHGDDAGGLDSPAAFADFAEECLEMGYGGFKIHGWGGGDELRNLDREIAAVHAVGDRVGDDGPDARPGLRTGDVRRRPEAQARPRRGRASSGTRDPYRDGGISQHGHRKLRQKLDTPILQTGASSGDWNRPQTSSPTRLRTSCARTPSTTAASPAR